MSQMVIRVAFVIGVNDAISQFGKPFFESNVGGHAESPTLPVSLTENLGKSGRLLRL